MSDMRDYPADSREVQIGRDVQDHLRAQNEKLREELARYTNDCVTLGGQPEKCSMVIADRLRTLYGNNQQLAKELALAQNSLLISGEMYKAKRAQAEQAGAECDRLRGAVAALEAREEERDTGPLNEALMERDALKAEVERLSPYIRAAYAQEFETDEQSPVEDLVRHAFVTLAERHKALRAEKARAEKAVAERDRLAGLLRRIRSGIWRLNEDGWRIEGGGGLKPGEIDAALAEVGKPAPAVMNAEDYGLYLVLRDLVRDAALAPAAREKLLNFLSRMDV